MALTKVNYIDNETVITAANMNAIQDEVIKNSEAIEKGIAAPTLRATYDEETQTMKFENVPKEVEDQLYAPSGYVTDMIDIASEAELDTALSNIIADMPDLTERHVVFQDNAGLFNGGFTLARIFTRVGSYATATFETYGYYGYTKWVKNCYNGSWYPLEWENPPMALGVEYRTTERWNGKAVYTKSVNCGYLSAVGHIKEYAHASDAVNIVRVTGSLSTGDVLPYHNTNTEIELSCTPDNVKIKTIAWAYATPAVTEVQATVQIWYTKD